MSGLEFERKLQQEGYRYIAGIDEVGRGCLAGPLVVASVVMPLDNIIDGVEDSKKLSASKREKLYDKIMDTALEVTVSVISNQIVDQINILNATKQAMIECIDKLQLAETVLVDAVNIQAKLPTVAIVHGDALSYSIAAASIVAKVTRDRMMTEYAKEYPQYGFEKHKGYGTKYHIEQLKAYGYCPLHRLTFIKNFVNTYDQ